MKFSGLWFTFFMVILFSSVSGKITFESHHTDSVGSELDNIPFEQVLVEEEYSQKENPDFEDVYISLRATHSSKKTAYHNLLSKYK